MGWGGITVSLVTKMLKGCLKLDFDLIEGINCFLLGRMSGAHFNLLKFSDRPVVHCGSSYSFCGSHV
jgi:hypothetical protein